MKKLFYGIGLLTAIFSIYFMLLLSDKMVYVKEDTVYDFLLENSVTLEELEDIAKDTDNMIYIRSYGQGGFGTREVHMTILNPSKNIQDGRQRDLFPNRKIIYQTKGYDKVRKTQFFTIQSKKEKNVKKVETLLQKKGIEYQIEQSRANDFTLAMVFSTLNIRFFLLMFCLLTLCIVTYYAHRLKEIGILKLNGWKDWNISVAIMRVMLNRTLAASGIVMCAMCIYILIMDSAKIKGYFRLCSVLLLLLLIVYVVASLTAVLFIRNVNQIDAIKKKQYNGVIVGVLVAVKIVTTALLLLGMTNLTVTIETAEEKIMAGEKLMKQDFFTLDTTVVPCKKEKQELDAFLCSLPNTDIYNYGSPEGKELEENVITLSDNLLTILQIKDENGKYLQPMGLKKNEECILIPQHLRQYTKEIRKNLACRKEAGVYYVEDGQTYEDLLWPGKKNFDSIVLVHGLNKKLYLNGEEVLYKKNVAKKMKEQLKKMKIDDGSIRIASRESEIQELISSAKIDAWEAVYFLVIDGLFYVLSVMTVVTIYFEFHKKQLGVYAVLGKTPWTVLGVLAAINAISVLVIAGVINPDYIWFLAVEMLAYWCYAKQYLNKRAVNVIKGE